MKIAIYGDSISEGIGKRKYNYVEPLFQLISNNEKDIIIDNKAVTGTTVKYMAEKIDTEKYDWVIIGYGNVDAMLRPDLSHNPNLYSFLPNRYKQNGMLNPRPYFSNKWYKRMFQHFDSIFRWNINRLLLKIQGSTTWVSYADFEATYKGCIEKLNQNGSQLILLSTVKVKEKYFPGTNEMYKQFNDILKKFAQNYTNCHYVDLFNKLDRQEYFYADGFHPNEKGYSLIAQYIYEQIIFEKG